jgi:hypothetical protein
VVARRAKIDQAEASLIGAKLHALQRDHLSARLKGIYLARARIPG